MRTVVFNTVYEQICRLAGLDPDDATLSAARQEAICDHLNRRVKEAWEYDMWPELILTENRAWRAAWENTASYVAGDEVYYTTDETYYQCIAPSTGNIPSSSPLFWSEITDLNTYLPYEPADSVALGEVVSITDKDPDRYADTCKSYPFVMTAGGAQVYDTTVGTTIWVKFRRRPNRFTRVAHDPTATYSVGDLVYQSTTGEVYQAVMVSGVETWNQISFPYIFEDFVVWAGASDYLRELAQHERAVQLEGRGYKKLEEQHTKVFEQQSQTRMATVRVQ